MDILCVLWCMFFFLINSYCALFAGLTAIAVCVLPLIARNKCTQDHMIFVMVLANLNLWICVLNNGSLKRP